MFGPGTERTVMEPTERVVHAAAQQVEVVRYDRAGEWWIEHAPGRMIPARRVKVAEAVDVALDLATPLDLGGPWGGRVYQGRWGGRTFDRLVKRRAAERGTPVIWGSDA